MQTEEEERAIDTADDADDQEIEAILPWYSTGSPDQMPDLLNEEEPEDDLADVTVLGHSEDQQSQLEEPLEARGKARDAGDALPWYGAEAESSQPEPFQQDANQSVPGIVFSQIDVTTEAVFSQDDDGPDDNEQVAREGTLAAGTLSHLSDSSFGETQTPRLEEQSLAESDCPAEQEFNQEDSPVASSLGARLGNG